MLKGFRDGTERTVPPEQTLARVRPLLRRLGITRVADVTGLDRIGIPVVSVSRPNARSLDVAQGKGLTLPAAEASGIMESIETYHAEHADLPLRLGSLAEITRSRRVVDLERLPRRETVQFSREQRLLWVEGLDLGRDVKVWVPYELVHLDYRLPLPPASHAFVSSSNGLASGNTVLEAILHGLCELVERDANALWRFSSEPWRGRRRVLLDSVSDSSCRRLLDLLDDAGIAVVVWDVTSDVLLPSFLCSIADRNSDPLRPMRPVSGSGCHPRREIALARALTEAAQGRLTLIAGSRDDVGAPLYDAEGALRRLRRFNANLLEGQGVKPFEATPTWDADSFEADLELVLEELQRAGLESIVTVDLTLPQIGIPVIRTIVPGLESIAEAPGYVPGVRAQRRAREAAS